MASPRLPSLAPASRYRPPELLRDIRLLDLLELCGTTSQASRLLGLSQPTVSRRYQKLRQDFALVRDRYPLKSCGYGATPTLRLLRLGCRAHRLAAGVARIGSDLLHQSLLAGSPWLLPVPPRFRAAATWLELVRQGVLDGALISGLELEEAEGGHRQELELVSLGELPLALGVCADGPGRVSEVLVPDRGVAPGLRRLLHALGLTLRTGGTSLQTPADWIARIQGSALALVVADREVEGWSSLRRTPLRHGGLEPGSQPSPLCSPVWLALPADWQEHPVLRQTVRELGGMVGAQPLEG